MTVIKRRIRLAACFLLVSCSHSGRSLAPKGAVSSSTIAQATIPQSVNSSFQTQSPSSAVAPATSSVPARCVQSPSSRQITLWHSLGGNTANDELDSLVAEFNRSHEDKLVAKKIGGYDDLLRALASTPLDQWPDIIAAPQGANRSLLDSHHFLSPDDCNANPALAGDLVPVVAASYSVDGKLRSVPFGVSAPLLLFDRAEFRKAGLDPNKPPATTAQLMAASAQIQSSGASPYGLVVSDHIAEWVVRQGAAKAGLTIGAPDNGRTDVGLTAFRANQPAFVSELGLYRDAILAGHAKWIGGLKSDFDDLLAIVADHDGATMTIHTSASVGDIFALLAAGNFPGVELGVAPMPGPEVGSLVGGNSLWLVDHADAERAGAAGNVIAWLAAPKQIAAMDAVTGYVPPTRSAAADPSLLARWAQQPELRVAYDQLASMDASVAAAGILIGPSIDFDFALYNASTRVATTAEPIPKILDDVDTTVDALIRSYRASHG